MRSVTNNMAPRSRSNSRWSRADRPCDRPIVADSPGDINMPRAGASDALRWSKTSDCLRARASIIETKVNSSQAGSGRTNLEITLDSEELTRSLGHSAPGRHAEREQGEDKDGRCEVIDAAGITDHTTVSGSRNGRWFVKDTTLSARSSR
ncbi:hypothetical protein RRG08_017731 [Elysia crispata]|uniref:Uncharacterized protein n=1 Tax=Elysia crispata TaxID=231223 RepID=A0AAE0XQY5_9GAST|nr:hypothetical protein RRG08_017731 [Elysia crispata]